jgi:hypothetical protein
VRGFLSLTPLRCRLLSTLVIVLGTPIYCELGSGSGSEWAISIRYCGPQTGPGEGYNNNMGLYGLMDPDQSRTRSARLRIGPPPPPSSFPPLVRVPLPESRRRNPRRRGEREERERERDSTRIERNRDGRRRARAGGVLLPAPGAPPRPALRRQRVAGGGASPGARGGPPPGPRTPWRPGLLPTHAPAVRLLHQPRRSLLLLLLRRRRQSDLVPQAQEPSRVLRSASRPASACLRSVPCPSCCFSSPYYAGLGPHRVLLCLPSGSSSIDW